MTLNFITRATGLTAALALLSGIPVSSLAETGFQGIHPTMNTRLQIIGGAFFANADPSYRLEDPDDGSSTKISGSDLGLDDDVTVPFAGLRWRITDRWRVEGQYFGFDDSATTIADERIEWGDLEFDAGASVRSKVETAVGRILGGYSFLKGDQAELGAGIGLHYLSFEAKLSGQASIDAEPIIEASEKADVSGVVPNVGLYGDFAFNERWIIAGRVDWFSANVDDFDGRLWRLGASVTYQPFRHVNFGVGYDYLDIDVDIDGDDWKGKIDADYYGPSVFVGLTF